MSSTVTYNGFRHVTLDASDCTVVTNERIVYTVILDSLVVVVVVVVVDSTWSS